MQVTCPACHRSTDIPSDRKGLTVECPTCGHSHKATDDYEPHQPASKNVGKLLVIAGVLLIGRVFVVLAALTSVRNGSTTQSAARNDIAQMEAAVTSCKVDLNNVPYLPSRIMLCRNVSDYTNNEIALVKNNQALAAASKTFLFRAFGRRLWKDGQAVMWDGGRSSTNGPWILYADQSLVFWLGGIPGPNGAILGFSTNPVDPSARGGTRKGPYFAFKSSCMFAGSMYVAQSKQPVPSPDPTNNGFYRYLNHRAGFSCNP